MNSWTFCLSTLISKLSSQKLPCQPHRLWRMIDGGIARRRQLISGRGFMGFQGRILRWLLIVGLIPAVLAAGLPMSACACDSDSAMAESACCGSAQTSCCGDAGAGCSCCQQNSKESSCENPGNDADAEPAVKCGCGVSAPVPAMPPSPSVELTLGVGLLVATLDAVIPAPVVPRSARRTRSALLHPADLPTTLCTLLI